MNEPLYIILVTAVNAALGAGIGAAAGGRGRRRHGAGVGAALLGGVGLAASAIEVTVINKAKALPAGTTPVKAALR